MELKELKKEYEKLSKKYKLPKLDLLNCDFEIDKFDKDTDYLLRAIRKMMMEKIVNSMGFLEMLLNPMNSPRMYMPYIRTMGADDKTNIDKIYFAFADLSLLSLELEVNSEEKKEAELINKIFDKWQEIKPIFSDILGNIKNPKHLVRKERSYFG